MIPQMSSSIDKSTVGVSINWDKCIKCGACVMACRNQGMNVYEFDRTKDKHPVITSLVKQSEEGKIVLLKDSPCIECGQCVSVCPTQAIFPGGSDLPRVRELLFSKILGNRSSLLSSACASPLSTSSRSSIDTPTQSYLQIINESLVNGSKEGVSPGDKKSFPLLPALMEKLEPSIFQTRPIVALVAPATRVAIGEALGDGQDINTRQLVTALHKIGFTHVYDVQCGADFTTHEDLKELQKSLEKDDGILFTSCCPSWIKLVEKHYPHLIKYVSTARSCVSMVASLVRHFQKHGHEAFVVDIMPCTAKKTERVRPQLSDVYQMGRHKSKRRHQHRSHLHELKEGMSPSLDKDSKKKDQSDKIIIPESKLRHVSVSSNSPIDQVLASIHSPSQIPSDPMSADHFISGGERRMDIDACLTVTELATLFRELGYGSLYHPSIKKDEKTEEGCFDTLFKESSGSSSCYGRHGGVAGAVMRELCKDLTGDPCLDTSGKVAPVDKASKTFGNWHEIYRLRTNVVYEIEVEIPTFPRKIKIIHATGGSALRWVCDQVTEDPKRWDFAEMMACPGGCIGGGGMPRALKPSIKAKRASLLDSVDEHQSYRLASQNPVIKRLYSDELSGNMIHRHFHTFFEPELIEDDVEELEEEIEEEKIIQEE
ncbi:hypothetical protein ADUPG1_009008 [Aduncisulcus paluster]|uniref:4Fe-4S ferredoxin-type domain-containing protein n=1 Tax=Aduncisulcus paluster TaxID=2918883 RepID=A0ABQ5KWY1_9EUKA|nr:hypothetical protein ADUPG1_009008 [Aduncisulcus paluster]